MVTKIESFARDDEERRLEEVVRTMKSDQREKYLEKEASMYLNMVYRYSSDKRLMQKAE
jgi:hypothetical protein